MTIPYDETTDSYDPPTDSMRIAWLEREVQELRRMIATSSYPLRRNTGGAVDIVPGWKG